MQGRVFWFLNLLFLSGINTRFCTNENAKAKKYWVKELKISPNLGLQPRDEEAMLGVKAIKIFSQGIYMKIEFLDHQYCRRDVKCTAAIHCNQMIGIRRMGVLILNVIWSYEHSEESFSEGDVFWFAFPGHNFYRST